jgi:transcriptional regulator with XRE-family HTH domain
MVKPEEVSGLLAIRLKSIREKRGLSQEKVAFEAGLNRAYIGYIERGERNPSVQTIVKIANALKVELQEIFDFS